MMVVLRPVSVRQLLQYRAIIARLLSNALGSTPMRYEWRLAHGRVEIRAFA